MDQRLKQMWVAALRSGEFVQGAGVLKTITNGKTQYCCLGVLCEIYTKENKDMTTESHLYHDSVDNVSFIFEGKVDSAVLPEPFRQKIDLTLLEQGRLISFNDIEGKNFSEIADWIEEHL